MRDRFARRQAALAQTLLSEAGGDNNSAFRRAASIQHNFNPHIIAFCFLSRRQVKTFTFTLPLLLQSGFITTSSYALRTTVSDNEKHSELFNLGTGVIDLSVTHSSNRLGENLKLFETIY